MRKYEKKYRVYVGVIDFEKAYDRVNRESLWQALRMYNVGVILGELRACMLMFSLCQSKRSYEGTV